MGKWNTKGRFYQTCCSRLNYCLTNIKKHALQAYTLCLRCDKRLAFEMSAFLSFYGSIYLSTLLNLFSKAPVYEISWNDLLDIYLYRSSVLTEIVPWTSIGFVFSRSDFSSHFSIDKFSFQLCSPSNVWELKKRFLQHSTITRNYQKS